MSDKKKILILGASGMLGNAMMTIFSADDNFVTEGHVRSAASLDLLSDTQKSKIHAGYDLAIDDHITALLETAKPDIVVNCVGIVKQLEDAYNDIKCITLNALLPHKIASICETMGARLVHISTDCVFTGSKGGYLEADLPDARDLYGLSKLLGEVKGPNAVTLRTSIIGHELNGNHSLVDWFLSCEGEVKGFTEAYFSGLTTFELARVVKNVVISKPELQGLYHVAVEPISKSDLITLIAKVYNKQILIKPCDKLRIDRSLNASVFNTKTGYEPPSWTALISDMKTFYKA